MTTIAQVRTETQIKTITTEVKVEVPVGIDLSLTLDQAKLYYALLCFTTGGAERAICGIDQGPWPNDGVFSALARALSDAGVDILPLENASRLLEACRDSDGTLRLLRCETV